MLLLAAVIVLALLIKNVYMERSNDYFDKIMLTLGSLMMYAALAGAVFGLAFWYATKHPSPVRNVTYDIVALSTGSETSGQFFLGFGYVNSEPMYYYYYKTDDGGLRMDYTNADLTVVKQDATADTSSITYFCEDYSVNDFWTWPFSQHKWSDCFNYVNEIHVPPNSIDTNFDASLPK